jgi:hypothetical protein
VISRSDTAVGFPGRAYVETDLKQLSGSKDKTLTRGPLKPAIKNLNLYLPSRTSPMSMHLISCLNICCPLS